MLLYFNINFWDLELMGEGKCQGNSVMHDATPSWNGFNYQGKVGIYVVLTLILKDLTKNDIESESFNRFLSAHTIQFEWIEDFSILKDDQYISHHQVKHKEGSAFSTHIKALVQIRSRNKRVLQESDLRKYPEIAKEKSHETILSELQDFGCLDKNRALLDNWSSQIEETSEYYKCLKEFDDFSSRAFSDSVVYFHTTNDVTNPANEDMSDYPDVPVHLEADFKGKTKLEELEEFKIYIGGKNIEPYKIVQTDEQLEVEIKKLIGQILEKTQSEYSSIRDPEKDMYYSSLQSLVHDHILYRHGLIRRENKVGNGYLEERPTIAFEELWKLFKQRWISQDKDYFELFCQKRFYIAYEYKLNLLLRSAKRNDSKRHFDEYNQLKKYVEEFISIKYKDYYRYLFRELAPHLFRQKVETEMLFYSQISERTDIDKVFLTFLSKVVISQNPESILIYKKDEKYYPSTVDLSADDEFEEQEKIIEFQEAMTDLKDNEYYIPNSSLRESNFFVVNAKNKDSVSGKTFHLRKITDVENGSTPTITENKIYLKRYQDALKEINENDD